MARFVWDGSKSDKMLKDAWQREVTRDAHVSKQSVIDNLTPEDHAVLVEDSRLVGSAYRRLCHLDRAGLL